MYQIIESMVARPIAGDVPSNPSTRQYQQGRSLAFFFWPMQRTRPVALSVPAISYQTRIFLSIPASRTRPDAASYQDPTKTVPASFPYQARIFLSVPAHVCVCMCVVSTLVNVRRSCERNPILILRFHRRRKKTCGLEQKEHQSSFSQSPSRDRINLGNHQQS